ncbi:MAG: SDR family NAD(P)-dependent oxidoreductase [Acidobacteriota bacterium]
MPNAIILGASSGIGRELARIMSSDGWTLGLASRNVEAMEELKDELGPQTHIQRLDITVPGQVVDRLNALHHALGDVDCVVVSSGIGRYNPRLEWPPEEQTIATNVAGFAAAATWAGRFFQERKRGQLVGISSVAGLRGSPFSPSYCASKAFMSNYLEGLRLNLGRFRVSVCDIRPGYVDTPMTKDQKGMFWVVDAVTAAKGIYRAMKKRKAVAYVPSRWKAVALPMKLAPGFLYKKLMP